MISGIAFLSIPWIVQKYGLGSWALSVGLATPCFLLAIAALGGNVGELAERILAALVFLAFLGYIVVECFLPQPPLSEWWVGHPSLLSAILGFLVCGVPAGFYAVLGRSSILGRFLHPHSAHDPSAGERDDEYEEYEDECEDDDESSES